MHLPILRLCMSIIAHCHVWYVGVTDSKVSLLLFYTLLLLHPGRINVLLIE